MLRTRKTHTEIDTDTETHRDTLRTHTLRHINIQRDTHRERHRHTLRNIEPITLHLRLAHVKIFGLQSYYFTANRWETMETVTDFIFLGSKITVDGDSCHEIKRCLVLGRKAMINLDGTLKSRDITLPTKVHLVKAMVFPVIMYGCES